MSGDELMNKLAALSPEDRKKEVVVEGEDGWFYGARDVQLIAEHHGRQIDEPDAIPDCIAITAEV